MPFPIEVEWGDWGTGKGTGLSALPMSDTGGLGLESGPAERIKKRLPSFQ